MDTKGICQRTQKGNSFRLAIRPPLKTMTPNTPIRCWMEQRNLSLEIVRISARREKNGCEKKGNSMRWSNELFEVTHFLHHRRSGIESWVLFVVVESILLQKSRNGWSFGCAIADLGKPLGSSRWFQPPTTWSGWLGRFAPRRSKLSSGVPDTWKWPTVPKNRKTSQNNQKNAKKLLDGEKYHSKKSL